MTPQVENSLPLVMGQSQNTGALNTLYKSNFMLSV